MTRIFAFTALFCLAVAALWFFVIVPQTETRFPDGWTWTVNTLGRTGYPDDTGNYADGTTLADDPVNISERAVQAESDGQPAGQVLMNDHYTTRNAVTNAVDWEFETNLNVDSKTGQIVSDDDRNGDYFLFPRNVSKTATYVMSNSSYHSLLYSFQREETIGGISTYVFAYHGDLENTQSYPDEPLASGERILCPGFQIEYWVEPVTGEVIQYREWCEGDWVVNSAGEPIRTLSRWGSEATGDDLLRQTDLVRGNMTNYLLFTRWIPMAFWVLGGLALIGAFLAFRNGQNKQQVPA